MRKAPIIDYEQLPAAILSPLVTHLRSRSEAFTTVVESPEKVSQLAQTAKLIMRQLYTRQGPWIVDKNTQIMAGLKLSDKRKLGDQSEDNQPGDLFLIRYTRTGEKGENNKGEVVDIWDHEGILFHTNEAETSGIHVEWFASGDFENRFGFSAGSLSEGESDDGFEGPRASAGEKLATERLDVLVSEFLTVNKRGRITALLGRIADKLLGPS